MARLDHDAYVQAVTFSPDGTQVATGSEDGSARVFETAPYALVRHAIDVMTRPLNPAEVRCTGYTTYLISGYPAAPATHLL
ncbi:MAG: hypothetical protein ACRDPO_16530 [Streptosporangiaceae bacterium]